MKSFMTDPLIDLVKNRILPSCPNTLEANVLRRIRLAKVPVSTTVGFFSFGTVFSVSVVAVLLTSSITLGLSTVQNQRANQRQLAMEALDFDVFNEVNLQSAHRSSR
jgi:hypothetical protein